MKILEQTNWYKHESFKSYKIWSTLLFDWNRNNHFLFREYNQTQPRNRKAKLISPIYENSGVYFYDLYDKDGYFMSTKILPKSEVKKIKPIILNFSEQVGTKIENDRCYRKEDMEICFIDGRILFKCTEKNTWCYKDCVEKPAYVSPIFCWGSNTKNEKVLIAFDLYNEKREFIERATILSIEKTGWNLFPLSVKF